MSGLVLKNINKTFPGDQQAIRDFNLEVKDREFLILVGPTWTDHRNHGSGGVRKIDAASDDRRT